MSDLQVRLIFDLDAMAFRACAASEKDCHWGDGLWSVWAEEADCIRAFESLLSEYRTMAARHLGKEAVKGAVEVFAESVGDNWRIAYEPTYKASRRKVSKVNRKPVGYQALIEYARAKYDVQHTEHYEGDDVIGILATSDCDQYRNVVVAIDKDFKTVPCEFLRVNDDRLMVIDKDQAEYNLMHQTLTGDVSDGYAGCAGVGAVGATKILDGAVSAGADLWQAVVNEFMRVEMGLTPAAFRKLDLESADLQPYYDVAWRKAKRQYVLARILKRSDGCPIWNLKLKFQ